jgi:hypothetical protein
MHSPAVNEESIKKAYEYLKSQDEGGGDVMSYNEFRNRLSDDVGFRRNVYNFVSTGDSGVSMGTYGEYSSFLKTKPTDKLGSDRFISPAFKGQADTGSTEMPAMEPAAQSQDAAMNPGVQDPLNPELDHLAAARAQTAAGRQGFTGSIVDELGLGVPGYQKQAPSDTTMLLGQSAPEKPQAFADVQSYMFKTELKPSDDIVRQLMKPVLDKQLMNESKDKQRLEFLSGLEAEIENGNDFGLQFGSGSAMDRGRFMTSEDIENYYNNLYKGTSPGTGRVVGGMGVGIEEGRIEPDTEFEYEFDAEKGQSGSGTTIGAVLDYALKNKAAALLPTGFGQAARDKQAAEALRLVGSAILSHFRPEGTTPIEYKKSAQTQVIEARMRSLGYNDMEIRRELDKVAMKVAITKEKSDYMNALDKAGVDPDKLLASTPEIKKPKPGSPEPNLNPESDNEISEVIATWKPAYMNYIKATKPGAEIMIKETENALKSDIKGKSRIGVEYRKREIDLAVLEFAYKTAAIRAEQLSKGKDWELFGSEMKRLDQLSAEIASATDPAKRDLAVQKYNDALTSIESTTGVSQEDAAALTSVISGYDKIVGEFDAMQKDMFIRYPQVWANEMAMKANQEDADRRWQQMKALPVGPTKAALWTNEAVLKPAAAVFGRAGWNMALTAARGIEGVPQDMGLIKPSDYSLGDAFDDWVQLTAGDKSTAYVAVTPSDVKHRLFYNTESTVSGIVQGLSSFALIVGAGRLGAGGIGKLGVGKDMAMKASTFGTVYAMSYGNNLSQIRNQAAGKMTTAEMENAAASLASVEAGVELIFKDEALLSGVKSELTKRGVRALVDGEKQWAKFAVEGAVNWLYHGAGQGFEEVIQSYADNTIRGVIDLSRGTNLQSHNELADYMNEFGIGMITGLIASGGPAIQSQHSVIANTMYAASRDLGSMNKMMTSMGYSEAEINKTMSVLEDYKVIADAVPSYNSFEKEAAMAQLLYANKLRKDKLKTLEKSGAPQPVIDKLQEEITEVETAIAEVMASEPEIVTTEDAVDQIAEVVDPVVSDLTTDAETMGVAEQPAQEEVAPVTTEPVTQNQETDETAPGADTSVDGQVRPEDNGVQDTGQVNPVQPTVDSGPTPEPAKEFKPVVGQVLTNGKSRATLSRSGQKWALNIVSETGNKTKKVYTPNALKAAVKSGKWNLVEEPAPVSEPVVPPAPAPVAVPTTQGATNTAVPATEAAPAPATKVAPVVEAAAPKKEKRASKPVPAQPAPEPAATDSGTTKPSRKNATVPEVATPAPEAKSTDTGKKKSGRKTVMGQPVTESATEEIKPEPKKPVEKKTEAKKPVEKKAEPKKPEPAPADPDPIKPGLNSAAEKTKPKTEPVRVSPAEVAKKKVADSKKTPELKKPEPKAESKTEAKAVVKRTVAEVKKTEPKPRTEEKKPEPKPVQKNPESVLGSAMSGFYSAVEASDVKRESKAIERNAVAVFPDATQDQINAAYTNLGLKSVRSNPTISALLKSAAKEGYGVSDVREAMSAKPSETEDQAQTETKTKKKAKAKAKTEEASADDIETRYAGLPKTVAVNVSKVFAMLRSARNTAFDKEAMDSIDNLTKEVMDFFDAVKQAFDNEDDSMMEKIREMKNQIFNGNKEAEFRSRDLDSFNARKSINGDLVGVLNSLKAAVVPVGKSTQNVSEKPKPKTFGFDIDSNDEIKANSGIEESGAKGNMISTVTSVLKMAYRIGGGASVKIAEFEKALKSIYDEKSSSKLSTDEIQYRRRVRRWVDAKVKEIAGDHIEYLRAKRSEINAARAAFDKADELIRMAESINFTYDGTFFIMAAAPQALKMIKALGYYMAAGSYYIKGNAIQTLSDLKRVNNTLYNDISALVQNMPISMSRVFKIMRDTKAPKLMSKMTLDQRVIFENELRRLIKQVSPKKINTIQDLGNALDGIAMGYIAAGATMTNEDLNQVGKNLMFISEKVKTMTDVAMAKSVMQKAFEQSQVVRKSAKPSTTGVASTQKKITDLRQKVIDTRKSVQAAKKAVLDYIKAELSPYDAKVMRKKQVLSLLSAVRKAQSKKTLLSAINKIDGAINAARYDGAMSELRKVVKTKTKKSKPGTKTVGITTEFAQSVLERFRDLMNDTREISRGSANIMQEAVDISNRLYGVGGFSYNSSRSNPGQYERSEDEINFEVMNLFAQYVSALEQGPTPGAVTNLTDIADAIEQIITNGRSEVANKIRSEKQELTTAVREILEDVSPAGKLNQARIDKAKRRMDSVMGRVRKSLAKGLLVNEDLDSMLSAISVYGKEALDKHIGKAMFAMRRNSKKNLRVRGTKLVEGMKLFFGENYEAYLRPLAHNRINLTGILDNVGATVSLTQTEMAYWYNAMKNEKTMAIFNRQFGARMINGLYDSILADIESAIQNGTQLNVDTDIEIDLGKGPMKFTGYRMQELVDAVKAEIDRSITHTNRLIEIESQNVNSPAAQRTIVNRRMKAVEDKKKMLQKMLSDVNTVRVSSALGSVPLNLSDSMRQLSEVFDNSRVDYASEVRRFITLVMDEQLMNFSDWLTDEFYAEFYDDINEVYKRVFNTSLPREENYSGKLYRQSFDKFGDASQFLNPGYYVNHSGSPSQLKQRTWDTGSGIAQWDVLTAANTYTQEMEHFIAYAEGMKKIDSILGNASVKDAITGISPLGEVAYDYIKETVQIVKSRGIGKVEMLRFMNTIAANFAKARLLASPVLFFKQASSILSAIPSISEDDFLKGMQDWMMNVVPITKDWYEVRNYINDNSDLIRERYEESIMNELAYKNSMYERPMFATRFQKNRKRVEDFLGAPIKYGDMVAVYGGFVPVMIAERNRLMRSGMSKDEATEKALQHIELAIKKTQQSKDAEDRDMVQNSKNTAWLRMFISAPLQQLRKEMIYLRETSRGIRALAGDKNMVKYKSKGKLVSAMTKFFYYHSVLPMAFQWISLGLPGILNPFDDDDADDILWAGTIGNVNTFFVAGQIIQNLRDSIEEKPYARTASVFDTAITSYKDATTEIARVANKKDLKPEDYVKAVTVGLDILGVPAQQFRKHHEKMVAVMEEKDPSWQQMTTAIAGYSKFVFEDSFRTGDKRPAFMINESEKTTPAPSGSSGRGRDSSTRTRSRSRSRSRTFEDIRRK